MDFLPTLLLVVAVLVIIVVVLLRRMRAKNPQAVAENTQNGLTIKVKYSQPSRRDRVIFGGVVPFEKLWRTGANEATTIQLGQDMIVAGKPLAKGRYSLFTIPTPSDWTIVFNRQAGQWGVVYNEAKDILRVTASTRAYPQGAEQFFISFEPAPGGMNMLLTWEHTQVVVPFRDK